MTTNSTYLYKVRYTNSCRLSESIWYFCCGMWFLISKKKRKWNSTCAQEVATLQSFYSCLGASPASQDIQEDSEQVIQKQVSFGNIHNCSTKLSLLQTTDLGAWGITAKSCTAARWVLRAAVQEESRTWPHSPGWSLSTITDSGAVLFCSSCVAWMSKFIFISSQVYVSKWQNVEKMGGSVQLSSPPAYMSKIVLRVIIIVIVIVAITNEVNKKRSWDIPFFRNSEQVLSTTENHRFFKVDNFLLENKIFTQ